MRAQVPVPIDLGEAVFAAEDELLAVGCREIDLPFGRLFVDAAHPSIYDVNSLRDVHGAPSLEELDRAFQRALSLAGCRHRRVATRDPATVRLLDDLLLPRAYSRQACVAMALTGDAPSPPVPRGLTLTLVDESDEQLVRALCYCQDLVRREELWYSPEVSRQMDELALGQVRNGGAELLAALTDRGDVAGSLLLRCDAGVGFIADVGTTPRWRRRGVASALVAAASALILGRGINIVGLTARRDEEPRRLYQRLGFQVVGESIDYLRA